VVFTIYQECRVCGYGWIVTRRILDTTDIGECPQCGSGWLRTLRIRIEMNPDALEPLERIKH